MNLLKSVMNRAAAIAMTVLLTIGVLSSSPATAATVEVKMGTDAMMMAFEPAQITVAPGDTLHFIGNHMGPHNVVFDGDLASASHEGMTMDGQTFDVQIPDDAKAGTYDFYCAPHRGANMVGKITVSG